MIIELYKKQRSGNKINVNLNSCLHWDDSVILKQLFNFYGTPALEFKSK